MFILTDSSLVITGTRIISAEEKSRKYVHIQDVRDECWLNKKKVLVYLKITGCNPKKEVLKNP